VKSRLTIQCEDMYSCFRPTQITLCLCSYTNQ